MPSHRLFPPARTPAPSPYRRREWRGRCNAKRLAYEASVLASVYGAVCLGIDLDLCNLLARAGLGEDAVTAIRFRGSGREYRLVLPTYRTWTHSRLRNLAIEVGLQAVASGDRVLIVLPKDVQLQPRLANACRIFNEKLVPACGDADAVACCIRENGGEASFSACEAALDSPLARQRIFGLVFGGQLELDFAAELMDRTMLRLRRPEWTFGWDALRWELLRNEQAGCCTASARTVVASVPHRQAASIAGAAAPSSTPRHHRGREAHHG